MKENNESESIRKEAAVAKFYVLFRHFPGEADESDENPLSR
jgi:hypothetical protein